MKRLLTVSFLLLLTAGSAAGAPAQLDGWLSDVDAAFKAAERDDRYVLVDLYADWCGWCKVLEEKVFTTPEFRRFADDFVLLRVDVEDAGEGSDLQARYGATSLPTTLILDADRVRVGEVRGFLPTRQFIASVRQELVMWEALIEMYEKVRASEDREMQRRLAEDFHTRGDGARAAELYERLIAQGGDDEAAWYHYLAADAYRLTRDFERAAARAKRARAMAGAAGDPELVERLDLLRFQLAQDAGDCPEAMASLEDFLGSHPRSSFSSQARRTLAALKRGELMECAS